MKIELQQISSGEDRILIEYKSMTPEIEKVVQILKKEPEMLLGQAGNRQYRFRVEDVYYFESVDEKSYAYLKEEVIQVRMTLAQVEEKFSYAGFFRCNKSVVLNMNKIVSVQSEMGSRINAKLDNGEHVIISRHYSGAFRKRLRGDEGE